MGRLEVLELLEELEVVEEALEVDKKMKGEFLLIKYHLKKTRFSEIFLFL